jgi:hypothetical protein
MDVHETFVHETLSSTADFVTELERRLGRPIARRAPGRKAAAHQ